MPLKDWRMAMSRFIIEFVIRQYQIINADHRTGVA
ncbi:hypothetical protein ECP02989429_2999, partial [Escherichia coli P0298942.9]